MSGRKSSPWNRFCIMKNREGASTVSQAPHALLSASGLLLGTLVFFCSPPPPFELQNLQGLCGDSFQDSVIRPGTASGDIVVRNNSEVHNGNIDVKQERDGLFKVDFYGPLGISIASLYADSQQGTISFEDRTYTFLFNQTMDTLPLEWGRDLTFKEFFSIIRGKIPEVTAKSLCKKQPDSLAEKRNTIYALWKTDSLKIRVEINRKSGQVKAASIYFNKHAPFWQLNMGSFHNGIAYKIQFQQNDGNYFLIHYTKVNF